MAFPAGVPVLDPLELNPSGFYAPTLVDFNDPREAITEIVAILGTGPEGVKATVAARLAQIESDISGLGSGGGGSVPLVDVGSKANTAQGGSSGWGNFHITPAITCATGVILDYRWLVDLNSSYPNKPFQVKVTDTNVAPSNQQVNGVITGIQPAVSSGDRWPCHLMYNYVGALAGAPLYFWGRFYDYDPNPNAAYANQGISFTVQTAGNNNGGSVRGIYTPY